MDGCWDLFCTTGNPVFYLLYRKTRESGEKGAAKTA